MGERLVLELGERGLGGGIADRLELPLAPPASRCVVAALGGSMDEGKPPKPEPGWLGLKSELGELDDDANGLGELLLELG